jgi:predicted Kef-type K+ transport protein
MHIPFVNTDTYPQIGMGFVAHNSFVSDLAETGVVGLAMTLALWGVAIHGLIRLLRRNEPVYSSKGAVLLLVLIVFLGASLVGNRGTIKLLWVLFGLCESQPVRVALTSFVSLFRRVPSSDATSRIAQPA